MNKYLDKLKKLAEVIWKLHTEGDHMKGRILSELLSTIDPERLSSEDYNKIDRLCIEYANYMPKAKEKSQGKL